MADEIQNEVHIVIDRGQTKIPSYLSLVEDEANDVMIKIEHNQGHLPTFIHTFHPEDPKTLFKTEVYEGKESVSFEFVCNTIDSLPFFKDKNYVSKGPDKLAPVPTARIVLNTWKIFYLIGVHYTYAYQTYFECVWASVQYFWRWVPITAAYNVTQNHQTFIGQSIYFNNKPHSLQHMLSKIAEKLGVKDAAGVPSFGPLPPIWGKSGKEKPKNVEQGPQSLNNTITNVPHPPLNITASHVPASDLIDRLLRPYALTLSFSLWNFNNELRADDEYFGMFLITAISGGGYGQHVDDLNQGIRKYITFLESKYPSRVSVHFPRYPKVITQTNPINAFKYHTITNKVQENTIGSAPLNVHITENIFVGDYAYVGPVPWVDYDVLAWEKINAYLRRRDIAQSRHAIAVFVGIFPMACAEHIQSVVHRISRKGAETEAYFSGNYKVKRESDLEKYSFSGITPPSFPEHNEFSNLSYLPRDDGTLDIEGTVLEFDAMITGGNNPYSWNELVPKIDINSGGTAIVWTQFLSSGQQFRSGTISVGPAYEVNGSTQVPIGSIVRMRENINVIDGLTQKIYTFFYPIEAINT